MGSNHENRMRGNGAGLMDRTTVGNVDRDVNVGVNIDTDVLGDAVSVDAAGGSKAQARDRLEGQPGAGHLYQRWADLLSSESWQDVHDKTAAYQQEVMK